jgi:drug/metabolite transporter (DMT)-like permease
MSPIGSPQPLSPLRIVLALLTVYLVWGSTYLAIRVALEGYAPLFFPGIRFIVAGTVLFGVLLTRGTPPPTWRQVLNASAIGFLLLNIGNGAVVLAERKVGSALAATAVATVPMWAALCAGFWGSWPVRAQWVGLALGFAGIVVMNLGGDFAVNPLSATLLIAASVAWAFGSVWSRRIDLPKGLMSSACQMLAAGVIFLVASAASGERWQLVSTPHAIAALLYLILFGSLLAFSAYMFLVQNVAPALATSYAYVNPVVALLLGATLGGEHFVGTDLIAIAFVLAGVALIVLTSRVKRP